MPLLRLSLVGVECPFRGPISGPKDIDGATVEAAHVATLVDAATGNRVDRVPDVLMLQLRLKDGSIRHVPERMITGYTSHEDSPA